jgi:hypothetical protein
MDKINKFKQILSDAVNALKLKERINNFDVCKLFTHINYEKLKRYKDNHYWKIPNLLELKEIEEVFQIYLKEYYPTQCEKAQAFIIKRLSNKILLKDMSLLLGFNINHYDLTAIENSNYEQYSNKQRFIYNKFMDLKI